MTQEKPGSGLARINFEAYRSVVGDVNFAGDPIPDFDHLKSAQQDGWIAGAHAVANQVAQALSDPNKLAALINKVGVSDDHTKRVDLTNNPAPQIVNRQTF
jgi:hypothetical protein